MPVVLHAYIASFDSVLKVRKEAALTNIYVALINAIVNVFERRCSN